MSEFAEWFEGKMFKQGYTMTYRHDDIPNAWMNFTQSKDDSFHVMYLRSPMTPEDIRQTFSSHNEPILFVIDILQLPALEDVDLWVRALHAIYYGRIYAWNGQNIIAVHYDWTNQRTQTSEPIDMSGILFTRVDSQLRDFPGLFYIARFYDRAFWKEQPKQQKQKGESWKERAKKQREEWEQATKGHSTSDRKYQYQQDSESAHSRRHTEEDIYEAFKRAFYEHMNNWGAYTHERTSQQRYTPQGDKWFTMLVQTGSLAEARKVYLRLAKENHPDINKSPEATAIMQQVNAAWEKVQEYLV